jgi:hypothetical protein
MQVQNPRAKFTVLDRPQKFVFDERRKRRSKDRSRSVPVSPGRVRFNLVPVPATHPLGGALPEDRSSGWVAEMCGGLAFGNVVLMWLIVILAVADGSGLFGNYMPIGIGLSFILSHVLGFMADGMSDGHCPWGMRAFGAFWISVLIWIPVGMFSGAFYGWP